MKADVFKAFVRETYIEPIRSVLIVDDDYPTLDEVLTTSKPEKRWHTSPDQIQKVISQFRSVHQPMIVDIHDGENVGLGAETSAVKYLHQSDLLVLDYELDRSKKGDGTKAIKIARNILTNNHFNLIIVHTREGLEKVFGEMLLALLPRDELKASSEVAEAAVDLISNAEDDNPDILDELKASMGTSHYLHARRVGCKFPMNEDLGAPSFAEFEAICQTAGWETDDKKNLVAAWAVSEAGMRIRGHMNPHTLSELTWSTDGPFWIRTDSGFIAFVNKADDADDGDLLGKLLEALCRWSPQPSRLFLAKLRSEIEGSGVIAEGKALGTKHVHANWYKRLLDSKAAQRDFILAETLSRHSEQLLATIMPGTTDFASRLIAAEDPAVDTSKICKNHFGVDLSAASEALRARHEHNAFVCSKAIEGYHLVPGHILTVDKAYWICLTPACDLVPGQKTNGRFEKIGRNLPFTAVRLQKVVPPDEGATRKVKEAYEKTYDRAMNAGRYMVINVDKALLTLSLNSPEDESSAPHWFTLFAANQGKFDGNSRKVKFYKNEQAGNGKLVTKPFNAKIVGQLRYEYALNLMSKLGVTMTRVGLDYQ